MKLKIPASEERQNLVYPCFYLVTPKLDDTNAFTLYNCEDRTAAAVRPAYLIKVQISAASLCLRDQLKRKECAISEALKRLISDVTVVKRNIKIPDLYRMMHAQYLLTDGFATVKTDVHFVK